MLGGTSQNLTIQGRNHENQRDQLYYFANGQNLFQQNIGTNTKVTISFDWKATNPTSGTFIIQYNNMPWIYNNMGKTRIYLYPTNSSGHVEVTFPSSDVENMSSAVASGIELRLDNVPTNTTITISNLKYEISQPKYVGTYTDKSETASQDPSKYTWKLNPDYHE